MTYALCLLRAPVIKSKNKQANQTQTRMVIGKQRHYSAGAYVDI